MGHVAIQIARAFGAEVFATVSPDKQRIVESFGAAAIDYLSISAEEYVNDCTAGKGFDIIFDTVGGTTLHASFTAVKLYGHVVSALGRGTHSLAPLSLRGTTFSGVFTLLSLITGEHRSRHGSIPAQAALLVDANKLRPLVSEKRFSIADIAATHALVDRAPREKSSSSLNNQGER